MAGGDVVRRLWKLFEARRWDEARELLTEDFVSEWPHSRELIRGRDNFIDLNRNYPEGWAIRVDRVIDAGETCVSEITVIQGDDASAWPRSSRCATAVWPTPASTGSRRAASSTRSAPAGPSRWPEAAIRPGPRGSRPRP